LGNKLIHFVFVPILLTTAVGMASFLPYAQYSLFSTPTTIAKTISPFFMKYFPINTPLFFIYSFMYPLTYLRLDLVAGISWLPVGIFTWWISNWFNDYAGAKALSILTTVHIISWIAQFIGHGLIEGRKPALLDNLYQSVVLAPFFVWFEGVLFPLGYKSEEHIQIKKRVKELQKEMDAKKN